MACSAVKEWLEKNRNKAVFAFAAVILLLLAGIFTQRYVSTENMVPESGANAELEARLQNAVRDIGTAKAEISELTLANEELRNRITSMDADIDASRRKIENLTRENNALKSQTEPRIETPGEPAAAPEPSAESADSVPDAGLTERVNALGETNARLAERISEFETSNAEAMDEIENLKAELKRVKTTARGNAPAPGSTLPGVSSDDSYIYLGVKDASSFSGLISRLLKLVSAGTRGSASKTPRYLESLGAFAGEVSDISARAIPG